MALAIRLASRAAGRTSPNPLVGAVIVKNGVILGKGYHHQAGAAHAEIIALAEAQGRARGADLYVNLEPCSHYGRTPPCVDALVARGVARVYIGMQDPNPLVSGRGIQTLKDAGIAVEVGFLEGECRVLNESFVKFITTGAPFVTLKAGASLDGKIATVGGHARWITNERSRQYVHRLRNEADAVLVGVGTVQKDDPLLTTRLPGRKGQDPVRIVVDSRLRVSLRARVFNPDSTAGTIIATTARAPARKIRRLEEQGVKVIVVPSGERVNLRALMHALGQAQITSVLIEGGSTINAAALEEGIVDKVLFFFAPRILGGRTAPPLVAGKGVRRIEEGIALERIRTRRFGDDVLIEGYVKHTASAMRTSRARPR